MNSAALPRSPAQIWLAAALTLVLYVAGAVVGSLVAVRPTAASPLYPAAGVAVLAVLLFGWRMVPAIALGSLCVRLLHVANGAAAPAPGAVNAALLSAIVLSPSLQAWACATGIRRFVAHPHSLSDLRDVLRFSLVAAVCCLIGGTFGNLARWTAGLLGDQSMPLNALVWWTGDLFGVLIVVPIGLALFGEPREAWTQRRLPVGLALLLATLAVGVGIRTVEGWHEERRAGAFERDAASASLLLSAQLRESLQALKALRATLTAAGATEVPAIPEAMRDWLGPGQLVALGWAPWLTAGDAAGFEQGVRSAGAPGFRIFDVPGSTPDPAAPVVPIRFIEPMSAENAAVVGLNEMSIPASRTALEASRQSGAPVASAGFQLQDPDAKAPRAIGVVVFHVLLRAKPTDGREAQPPLGAVFTTLRPGDQVRAVKDGIAPYLKLCLYDVTQRAAPYRLAGDDDCESIGGPRYDRPIDYAGRHWEVRVRSRTGEAPNARDADVWLFALVGLGSTAVLGGFLLIATARAQRIETAVRERTAALQSEVAERELAQTALRESEQRFRNILNNVPMGVCYTDLRGNLKLVNPRFCELVDRTEDDLMAVNVNELTHPDDRAEDFRLSRMLVLGEIPTYRRQKRYLRGDTELRVQETVTLLRDAAGKPRRMVGVVEDVSEHKKLEDAERAREAAEASNRAKSEFLSRMSHELRTPLNAMLGFAQLLELDPRQPLSDTQRPWVTQIQQAGWHLLEMINDVLDLSRIDSGHVRLRTETLSVDALIDASRAMVQGDAVRRRITISQDRDAGALNAVGDATRVKQILTNLLSNAVKYNVDGGTVNVEARQISAQTVEIRVTDSGLGMSPEQLGQLFEPFNRLGREKSDLEGTGIGLVISRRLAETMGGELRATSVAGAGSTFILSLPCENEPDTIRSEFDPIAREPADYHRRIVHYVEDNETNVEVMRGILAQRPQVELEVSVTGLDGLAAIRSRRPDLILLDMHLPDISGMELLRHFKGDPALASIPVIVVSADALREQIVAAQEAGCTAYLTKPVNIADLLHEVDTLLEAMDTRFG